MTKEIISGKLKPSEDREQKKLFQQLGAFSEWMKQEKDSSEIRKDKRQSVPIAHLPMVF